VVGVVATVGRLAGLYNYIAWHPQNFLQDISIQGLILGMFGTTTSNEACISNDRGTVQQHQMDALVKKLGALEAKVQTLVEDRGTHISIGRINRQVDALSEKLEALEAMVLEAQASHAASAVALEAQASGANAMSALLITRLDAMSPLAKLVNVMKDTLQRHDADIRALYEDDVDTEKRQIIFLQQEMLKQEQVTTSKAAGAPPAMKPGWLQGKADAIDAMATATQGKAEAEESTTAADEDADTLAAIALSMD